MSEKKGVVCYTEDGQRIAVVVDPDPVDGTFLVCNLRDAVKEKCKPLYDAIPAHQIPIALRGDTTPLKGGDPLVDGKECQLLMVPAEVVAASHNDSAKIVKIVEMLTIAHATTLIPHPTSFKTKRDPKFRKKIVEFYKTDQCVFLATKFPRTARANCFSCMGAHIYDHRMQEGAKSLGLEINNPRNGLPLFKSLEEKFDEGHIAIVPIDIQSSDTIDDTTTTLQILVCNELMDQVISVQHGKTKRDLTIGKGKHSIKRFIKFGDLHETTVVVSSPYLRALMLKQHMCYSQHPDEFPPPDLTLFGKSTSPQKSKDEVQAWIQSLQPPMPQSPVEKRQRDAQDVIPRKRRKKNTRQQGGVWTKRGRKLNDGQCREVLENNCFCFQKL